MSPKLSTSSHEPSATRHWPSAIVLGKSQNALDSSRVANETHWEITHGLRGGGGGDGDVGGKGGGEGNAEGGGGVDGLGLNGGGVGLG